MNKTLRIHFISEEFVDLLVSQQRYCDFINAFETDLKSFDFVDDEYGFDVTTVVLDKITHIQVFGKSYL